ncbi:FtsX-like permease family protein (plasmid) [Lactococcus lactis]|uniref:ABC transporter permease n=1 Tax=Lactococcus lactis TaxID=1358 RepID=UPI0033142A35
MYQFLYSKKQWLSTIPLILITSLIIGISLNGIFSVQANIDSLQGSVDPTPIFLMPIFFGAATLYFCINTIIAILIENLQEDYQLWAILGANTNQLSLLIGGQFLIISMIVSLFGSFLSVPCSQLIYHSLQSMVGENMLPDLKISINFKAALFTVIISTVICFCSGFIHAKRLLRLQKEKPKLKYKIMNRMKFIFIILISLIWVSLVVIVSFNFSLNYGVPPVLFKAQLLFVILLIHILFLQQISPKLYLIILNRLYQLNIFHGYANIMAIWKISEKTTYLHSLISSMSIAVILLSGLQLLSDNIFSTFQTNSELEFMVSILLYLGAPLVIIIFNIITLTLLTSDEEVKNMRQLSILGLSQKNFFKVKFYEALLYSFLNLVTGFIFNSILLYLTFIIFKQTFLMNSFQIRGLFMFDIVLSLLLFAIVFFTNYWRIIKIKWE